MGEKIALLEEGLDRLPRYKRPNGMISGVFTRVLAPLPKGMPDTDINDDTDEIMKSLPSYWGIAWGLLATFIVSVSVLSVMTPQLFVSPLSLVVGFMSTGSVSNESIRTTTTNDTVILIVAVIVAVLGLYALRSRKSATRLIYGLAHQEEKWFRSGAESWTIRQRIVSCLSFGLCHVINIIYPVVTLLLLSAVGAVFMATYLREYRRSHDTYRATLAATKLHARYNTCVFWFIGGVLVLYGVLCLVDLWM